MQPSTKPGIQIHESGRMFRLCSEGRVIGFAASRGFAQIRASELESSFSVDPQISDVSAADTTESLTFGSRKAGVWLVEVLDAQFEGGAFQIAAFPTAAEAGQFRDQVEAYHRSMPESEAEGEWSDAQIAWFKTHPAPMASACGGVLRIRYQGVH
ncbi:hypothetical protein LOY64_15310 [Pseudomonas corrugata]|uniref:hypothetical protein n=1 Tax=Pseudomonas corrugata TaxID=47879 RepID=UPI00222F5750|nr:hypothetical protein [Pseudomonas corrugata]UZD92723.1 hypothetical protein LOY64_15310 [Pseudomonas corrugata]